mgnify:CR=1 FL=1
MNEGFEDAEDGVRHGRYVLAGVPPWIEIRSSSGGGFLRRLLRLLLRLLGRPRPAALRFPADEVTGVETFRKRLWGFQSKRPASARPWVVEIVERSGARHPLAFRREDQAKGFANALRRLVAERRTPEARVAASPAAPHP